MANQNLTEAETRHPSEIEMWKNQAAMFQRNEMPRFYWGKNLATYARISAYHKRISVQAAEWAINFKEFGSPGLFIHGPVGTGKTGIGWALLMYIFEGREILWDTVRGWNMPGLLSEIRDTMRHDSRKTEKEIVDEASNATLLLLDDLAADVRSDSTKNEWAFEVLYRIVNARFESCRPTVFTSNLSLSEIQGAGSNANLQRVCSRIAQDTVGLEINCKDLRLRERGGK